MPWYRTGAEIQQNPIRFNNLLAEAESRLINRGKRATEASWMLDSARRFLNFHSFWQYDANGLAAFIAPGMIKLYRTPSAFPDMVIISRRFYVKPILPMITGNMQYYVLDLDLSGVRLFAGTRYLFSRIESETLPGSMETALMYDREEKQQQIDHKPQVGSFAISAVYGYGRTIESRNEHILEYYHIVNNAVCSLLNRSNAPLILGGTEFLHPMYRQANNYPHLLDQGIMTNCKQLTENELHQRALEFATPHFTYKKKYYNDLYLQLSGQKSPLATSNLEMIVASAIHGRIETLFITDEITLRWGAIDRSRQEVLIHEHQLPDDEDLLERAAIETILRGGVVYIVRKEEMPDAGNAAAILRY
jgi:hypothetical protein